MPIVSTGNPRSPSFMSHLPCRFILFGNVLLPLLGHIVFLCLEVMELLFENFLEWAFGVELHDAQMITAWTGFLIFSMLLIELAKKTTCAVQSIKSKLTLAKFRVF
jgi:hypothetical protein